MKQFIDKLIERLEKERCKLQDAGYCYGLEDAIKIINQLAGEYNNGWISVEDRLPKYTDEYNVTIVVASELGSFENVTTLRYENIKGKEPKWVIPKDKVYRVIAWQPLPEPFKPKGE